MVDERLLLAVWGVLQAGELGLDVLHHFCVVGYLIQWDAFLYLNAKLDGAFHIVYELLECFWNLECKVFVSSKSTHIHDSVSAMEKKIITSTFFLLKFIQEGRNICPQLAAPMKKVIKGDVRR